MDVISTGSEWIVDASGCDSVRLGDLGTLRALFLQVIGDLALNIAAEPVWKKFPLEGGITGMILLQESHLTIHTFPEHEVAAINLYCCTERAAWDWQTGLADALGAATVNVRRLRRGTGF